MKYLFSILSLLILWPGCRPEEELADAYGNFEAVTTIVSAEGNGRLLSLKVEEGQVLQAGQLIGLIDTVQLHLQRQQLSAQMKVIPQKLQDAAPDVAVLEDQRRNLLRELERLEKLVAAKAAPSKQLDDLKGELVVLDQRMLAVRQKTKDVNRGILSEQSPIEARIASIDDQIRRCYIYNPVSGTVLYKLAEPSEMTAFGAPLYKIASLDTLTLRAYAGAAQVQQMKIGQQVMVLVDDGADGFRNLNGRISWIAAEAEFTPKTIQTKEERINLVYAVKVEVPNADGRLKIGMPAEVWLDTQRDFARRNPKQEDNGSH